MKIWFQNRRMKWRNSKERELIAQGGCREQTLPTKNNPNPDLSDPQQHPQRPQQPPQPPSSTTPASNHLEAMAKTRLAFNETLWTLPPPLHQTNLNSNNNNEDEIASVDDDEIHDENDEDLEDDDEEINVT